MRYIVSEGEKREKRRRGEGEREKGREGGKKTGGETRRFFFGLREWKKEFLAPDICRGRNEYGGVYSAPRFPPFRRNLSFTENAGFCSSKLLRLVSPPTNVGGEEGTHLRIRCADSHLCEEAGVATPLRADEYAYCQKDFFAPMSFNVKSGC